MLIKLWLSSQRAIVAVECDTCEHRPCILLRKFVSVQIPSTFNLGSSLVVLEAGEDCIASFKVFPSTKVKKCKACREEIKLFCKKIQMGGCLPQDLSVQDHPEHEDADVRRALHAWMYYAKSLTLCMFHASWESYAGWSYLPRHDPYNTPFVTLEQHFHSQYSLLAVGIQGWKSIAMGWPKDWWKCHRGGGMICRWGRQGKLKVSWRLLISQGPGRFLSPKQWFLVGPLINVPSFIPEGKLHKRHTLATLESPHSSRSSFTFRLKGSWVWGKHYHPGANPCHHETGPKETLLGHFVLVSLHFAPLWLLINILQLMLWRC